MRTCSKLETWIVVAVVAALAATAVAPLAEAGHVKKGRRHRGPVVVEKRVVQHDYRPLRRVRYHSPYGHYTVWRSSSGPVFAGFVGGLFLGATLANAAPAGFTYWDPYCHRGFASLDVYYSHSRHHRHHRVVHVVEVPYGHDWDDYHYCDHCGEHYWGHEHDCD